MMAGPPNLVALDPDDYHARHVGRTADGRQFFVTTPFDVACPVHGHAFVAVFLFNVSGKLLEAKIDDVGACGTLDREAWGQLEEQRVRELGWTLPKRIMIAPFEIERFGLKFGLIPAQPKRNGESWWVELHPGNYMAFHEPWDSGIYDT